FPYAVRSPDPKIRGLVKSLQDQVKDQGLWAIFLDEELAGPGYGQLKLGLLNEILGRYPSAPQMFGAAAPDTGNMEMLAAYGTDEQKKRWLEPLLNQEMFSAYSMTEPQGGSDPNLFRTHAVRDGEEWVINGEKWFTSAGRVADLLFVMCTNGMFVVPRVTPGVEIMPEPRNHNHIIYRDVRVPLDHLLGPEDGAKVLAQRRLGRRRAVPGGQGPARGALRRAAHPRFARHPRPHPDPGDVRGGTHHGHRRRRRRGPQGHRRPQCAEGLPPPRGLLAHRVRPGQARGGGEDDAARPRRPT